MSAALAMTATVAAFNLVCTGTVSSGDISHFDTFKTTGQFRTEYRVDLASGRYCKYDCEQTSPIARFSDTVIVFDEKDDRAGNDVFEVVNRESGKYGFRIRNMPMVVLRQGECERTPFTGFPARKF